jgi:hypothetical protein
MRRFVSPWSGLLLALSLCATPVLAQRTSYGVDYRVEFKPDEGGARVSIAIEPDDGRVVRLVFSMDPERYSDIRGDGELDVEGRDVRWQPPRDGGTLSYLYRIDSKRSSGAYDARITDDWAIVRGDDLVPSAKVTSSKGADSRARLELVLPRGWSHADTPWKLAKDGKTYVVVNAGRRFDRPTGWFIAGDIGARRDVVEGMEIAAAAPKGDAMPRMEILSMLTATAPVMRDAFGKLPAKILVVGAGDPMWRGGLSGPRSLWMHSDRPLISENGSSTLMHEVVHVVTRIRGVEGDDWIAEGIADFYGMELLRRAGLLSDARFEKSIGWMRNHGRDIKSLHAAGSSGPRTARAVALFADLDAEIRKASGGKRNLDAVAQALIEQGGRVSSDDVRSAAEAAIGGPSTALATPLID